MSKILSPLAFTFIFLISCQQIVNKKRVIIVQPFSDFSPALTELVYQKLKTINPKTEIRKPIELPVGAYFKPRNRYKAQSIIDYLSKKGSRDTVIIALSHTDISITKHDGQDSGIMGLGFVPGRACVVSSFRLRKKNLKEQLIKLCLHELGHTEGLPHCEKTTCFMRAAKGKNIFNEVHDFCKSCKSHVKSNGWNI